MNKNRTGMLIFLGSEAFFFLALIIAYAFYAHPEGRLSATASYLDFSRTAVFTLFLFSSSATIALADRQLKRGNRAGLVSWIAATIVLGLVFIIGQGFEYARLISLDVTVSRNVFGSAFFTLTGFHGLHVIGGLILLSVTAITLLTGNFKRIEATLVDSASLYWHFVDIVWVFVFSIVYIGAII